MPIFTETNILFIFLLYKNGNLIPNTQSIYIFE